MTPLPQNSMVRGRYLVVQMIGSGDTGEVYLAVDQGSGSAVMLKRTLFADDEALKQELELRSKPLLGLRHPVLPKIIESFVEDGQHFLVMEHISGQDLATRLEESRKPFPLSWCMFWADQLLDALTYMHSHTPPIIHGDIKPTNLKLTEENHIVLLDHALGGGQNLLPEGERKFGPYASPEQARGIPLSSASDIYSFSATFYNLMTNVVPPGARKRADAIRSGLPDPLVSLSKANPEISADIAQVMERGLEVSADKRFAVAIEMQKALRRAYKKAKEGTTAQTVEFKRSDEPTVEMQGQANVIEADAVTVTNDVAPETAELPTRTHIGGPGAEPTIELGAADIVPDPIAADIKTEMLPVAVTGAAPEPVTPAVRPAARPPAKRSRAGLFIGGLLALLVLAGMGLGGGWYFYNNYYKTAVVTPSATPLPSPVISPSPTPETVVASDSNINTNSNSVRADTNSNDDNPGKVTVGTTIPTTGKPPQTPARTVAVRTPQPPKTRPSAKPKAGDDRTVILQ